MNSKLFFNKFSNKILACFREKRLPWKVKILKAEIQAQIEVKIDLVTRWFYYLWINSNKDRYLAYFDRQYKSKLVKATHELSPNLNRYVGFRKIFEELFKLKEKNFTIVETGTLRKDGNWVDGQSSLLFYEFVSIFGGSLMSIDILPENVVIGKQTLLKRIPKTGKAILNLIVDDSLRALKNINETVDFLYLDSYDLDINNPKPSMEHHFNELKSSVQIMRKNKNIIIATDDNVGTVGKGKYVLDWAKRTGQEILLENYQSIFRIVNFDAINNIN